MWEWDVDVGFAQIFDDLLVQGESEWAEIFFLRPRPKGDFDGAVAKVGNVYDGRSFFGLNTQWMVGCRSQYGGFGGFQVAGVIDADNDLGAAQGQGGAVGDAVGHDHAVG